VGWQRDPGALGQGVRGQRSLKLKDIHFSDPKDGRNLAHCPRFLVSFEFVPTEQLFLPHKSPTWELGNHLKALTVAMGSPKPKTKSVN